MEELQDAIEDAQYVNAMHDDSPKPTKSWKWPTVDEVSQYVGKLRQNNPEEVELETICKSCLGFYLFVDYTKKNEMGTLGSFLYELAAFRVSQNCLKICFPNSVIKFLCR